MSEQPEWIECKTELPPEGEVVLTKIDDSHGPRNERPLRRQGRLWFFPEDHRPTYVYYTPTHWRRLEE